EAGRLEQLLHRQIKQISLLIRAGGTPYGSSRISMLAKSPVSHSRVINFLPWRGRRFISRGQGAKKRTCSLIGLRHPEFRCQFVEGRHDDQAAAVAFSNRRSSATFGTRNRRPILTVGSWPLFTAS